MLSLSLFTYRLLSRIKGGFQCLWLVFFDIVYQRLFTRENWKRETKNARRMGKNLIRKLFPRPLVFVVFLPFLAFPFLLLHSSFSFVSPLHVFPKTVLSFWMWQTESIADFPKEGGRGERPEPAQEQPPTLSPIQLSCALSPSKQFRRDPLYSCCGADVW